ncbi:MAG: hypothetical protein AAFP70_17130 [Calditrichota bacterium]
MAVNSYDALLKITEQLNSMLESKQLLDQIMDIAMDAVSAERGFLLLKTAGDTDFEAVTARNISDDHISSIRDLLQPVPCLQHYWRVHE